MKRRIRSVDHVVAIGLIAAHSLFIAAPACADTQIMWRGLLDLVAPTSGTATTLNGFNRGDSNFDTYRLRVFAEAEAAHGFEVFTQFLYEEVAGVRTIGAYARYTPVDALDVHAVAGKIPWLIGTWQTRTYSNENPLIGVPLMYQYHTSLRGDALPPDVDALLSAAGRGQFRPDYGSGRGFRGMPIVYDLCWDIGAMAQGSVGSVEFSAGFVNGAPSQPTGAQDSAPGKSILGRLGVQPVPGLLLGVSGSYGPYLSEDFNAQLPAGETVAGYNQKLLMVDAEWSFGHVELRGEGFTNTWETPTAGDLDVLGGYVEARVNLPQGTFAAGRWGQLRFGDVTDSTGVSRPWDHDVDRLEIGAGYRMSRNVILKGVFQQNIMHTGSGDETASLFAAQASIRF